MTAIPAAVDALVAMFTEQLPDAQIVDGPPLVELEKSGIAVGYAVGTTTVDQVAVTSTEEGAGLDTTVETFDVNCLAWQRSGDTDVKAVRDATFALITTVDVALSNDRRLGGAVVNARLRVLDLDQMQNGDGTWAVVAFSITCTAFK